MDFKSRLQHQATILYNTLHPIDDQLRLFRDDTEFNENIGGTVTGICVRLRATPDIEGPKHGLLDELKDPSILRIAPWDRTECNKYARQLSDYSKSITTRHATNLKGAERMGRIHVLNLQAAYECLFVFEVFGLLNKINDEIEKPYGHPLFVYADPNTLIGNHKTALRAIESRSGHF